MAPMIQLMLIACGLTLSSLAAKVGTTMELKRQPDVFTPGATFDVARGGWKAAGRSIPMNGGVLTLGAYFVEVTIGTGAGQVTFDAVVDTGSSNLAIPAVNCPTCNSSTQYNPSASPTAAPLLCSSDMCNNCIPTAIGSTAVPPSANASSCPYGRPMCSKGQCGFGVSYGGSSSAISGVIGTDQVCIAGICANAYVNQITAEYPTGTLSTGIVGLAFPANACNPTCQPTVLDSFVAQGAISASSNKFGMCLTRTNGGILDLGFHNSSRYYGPLQYTSIVLNEWFNIAVLDIFVGGHRLNVPRFLYQTRNDALGSFVDSGTSIVIISPYAFQVLQQLMLSQFGNLRNVQSLFGGATGTVVQFNSTRDIHAYPKVEFLIRGEDGKADFTVAMEGSDYIMPVQVGSTSYTLAIMGVPSIGVILGDIIMHRYYIAFDRVNGRLGFAPIRHC